MLKDLISRAVLLAALSAPALAEPVKGTFVGPGTYATKEGCEKVKALAAGAERSLDTVPETLTENGFESWEGGCTFQSVVEKEPGKIWEAKMLCGEGAEEDITQSDLFERLPDGNLKVTVEDEVTILERCDKE